MEFVSATAKQFRIPRPVVEQAFQALLQLLRRHGEAEDLRQLLDRMPEAAALLGPVQRLSAEAGLLSRLGEFGERVMSATAGPRTTKSVLLAAGLRDAEVVPFVSAFLRYARRKVDLAPVTRLIESVPGLNRLTGWPVGPFKV